MKKAQQKLWTTSGNWRNAALSDDNGNMQLRLQAQIEASANPIYTVRDIYSDSTKVFNVKIVKSPVIHHSFAF